MIKSITKAECLKILENNCIGHLAYIYKNSPFVVPITYFYDKKSNSIIGYTGEGHKTKALKKNKFVALEIAEIKSIDHWRTVLVHGTYEELKGPDAKFELHEFSLAVKNLISEKEQKEYQFIPQFSDKTHPESQPIVYRINIMEVTGKSKG
ncbi:pyridoxamine 5'-phosphate oxidase family protein [Flavisericum labens]|uniref:pyridoxamine 5'-phosphate oxidase family protein n=1 Tax=Flavisericum labens TaxID=3377112 RepID=UPI00387B2F72